MSLYKFSGAENEAAALYEKALEQQLYCILPGLHTVDTISRIFRADHDHYDTCGLDKI